MSTESYINEKIAGVRRSLGNYRLLRILNEGATGVVLEAEHYTLGRRVALKTLNPKGFERSGMGVRELTEQFLHEARVMGSIEHPNVLPIYDAGFARGGDMMVEVPFLALRLMEAGDLTGCVMRNGPFDDATAIKVLLGSALGLQAVHKAGFVHRDLKPGNVLVEADFTPRLTDFSAASARGLPPRHGVIVGTSGYLAPEHVRDGVCNEATDLYALGATIYYVITGKAPYQVAPEDLVLWAENETSPPDPRQVRPTIDKRLALVVSKSLHPDPGQRYSTVAQLLEDVQSLVAGKNPGHASGNRPGIFWR